MKKCAHTWSKDYLSKLKMVIIHRTKSRLWNGYAVTHVYVYAHTLSDTEDRWIIQTSMSNVVLNFTLGTWKYAPSQF